MYKVFLEVWDKYVTFIRSYNIYRDDRVKKNPVS